MSLTPATAKKKVNVAPAEVVHDGVGWRIVVEITEPELVFSVERSDTQGWLPCQQWRIDAPQPKQRRVAINASCREHGWILPAERWPRIKNKRLELVEVFPWDWETIIRETDAYRAEVLRQAALVDKGWRSLVVEATSSGHVSVPRIAKLVGVQKTSIYRIKTDDLSLGNAGSVVQLGRELLGGTNE